MMLPPRRKETHFWKDIPAICISGGHDVPWQHAAPCPMPHAIFAISHELWASLLFALYSLLSALCAMHYAPCALPSALCSLPYALCPMLYALSLCAMLVTPLGVQLFFKQGSHKAPLTHIEDGASLFCSGKPNSSIVIRSRKQRPCFISYAVDRGDRLAKKERYDLLD